MDYELYEKEIVVSRIYEKGILLMKNIRKDLEEAMENGLEFIEDYDFIENILSEYMSNKIFLKSFRSTGDAFTLASRIEILKKDSVAKTIFYDSYNLAELFFRNGTSEKIRTFLDLIVNTQNFLWSEDSLNKSMENAIDEYAEIEILFKHIDSTVEFCLKPYVVVLVDTVSKIHNYNIKSQSLGDNIQYLLNYYKYYEICNMAVSQWRNIASHKSYKYNGDKIICKYGPKLQYVYDIESIDILREVTNNITKLYNAIYLAFSISSYNYMDKIKDLKIAFRDELWQENIKIAVASLNFKNKNSIKNANEYTFEIMDMLPLKKETYDSRLIQASFFSTNFWVFAQTNVRIVFFDRDCKKRASFYFYNKDFTYMQENTLDRTYMMQKMIFEFLDNPF